MKIIQSFDFTGNVQTFTAQRSGIYKLETWGAEGGTHKAIGQKNLGQTWLNGVGRGGYGGYSVGYLQIKKGTVLYVFVGGRGNDETERTTQIKGGWNGGGSGKGYSTYNYNPTGGGATDIATVYSDVTLDSSFRYVRTKASYDSRLIVSGGGGAGCLLSSGEMRNGGHGGGYIGNDGLNGYGSMIGKGGSQTAGGSSTYKAGEYALGSGFGHDLDGGSGGGGYYGGGESRDSGAGGGSGFIGKVNSTKYLKKKMVVYECQHISNDPETYTINTDFVSDQPIPLHAKSENGFARITSIYFFTNFRQINSSKIRINLLMFS